MELDKYYVNWDLYDKTFPKECREANQEINSYLLFNLGGIFAANFIENDDSDALKKALEETMQNMQKILGKYTKLGGLDSEPRQQLSEVINSFLKDCNITNANVDQYGAVFVSTYKPKM
jgi:hypothetical protein